MNDRGRSRTSVRKRIRNRSLSSLAIGLSVVWAGCSVERHYDILSFFFDGVPNPNALPIMAASGDVIAIRLSPTYSAHTPYLQGECASCHGRGFTMGGVEPTACLDCHDGVRDAYHYMHGPVAIGACLVCHVAHESAYPVLLKGEGRPVCMQCHDASMLSSEPVPEHQDESVSCLDCHFGHGGSVRFLLRDHPAQDREQTLELTPRAPED